MYDELVKRLRDAAKMSEALAVLLPHSEGNATAKLYNAAADAIEELTDTNVGKWIPVTERLPEEDGRYLTVYWLGTIPNTPWTKTAWFAKNLRNVISMFPKKKPGFYDSDSEYGYFEITGVTHWMPLPQPPKEET